MLNFGNLRNLYKSVDRINAEYQVIAEWNMNKYVPIKEYGLYKGWPGINIPGFGVDSLYPASNTNYVVSGENYLIYDDGSKEVSKSQEFFSNLASVFQPNRPDPGIILLQNFPFMTFVSNATNIKIGSLSTASARYYPFSKNRKYDYFNSAKVIDSTEPSPQTAAQNYNRYLTAAYAISNPETGAISNANPFVIYDSAPFICNKITIKVQNHLCVPKKFYIDVITTNNDNNDPPTSNTWTNIYSSTDPSDFSTGILNIYFNAGGWSKNIARIDDLNQLTAASPTELQKIRGIRLRVQELTFVNGKYKDSPLTKSPASLELIEISPRVEMDLTQYVESFNYSTSIGDSTSFGLPVGAVVSGAGNIILSNEDNQFLISSTLSSLKMLNQDVKLSLYQKVYVPQDAETVTVPLKVLYSNQWNVSEDYSVSIDLEDGVKYLRETSAPDLLFSSQAAMSAIILILLDNVGITGLEFKKSSDATIYDKEDTVIKNFFCKKEQTVAEVLEQIAIATQCSMFYDASGKLNVLTKEKLSENASSIPSTGPSDTIQKTDFWFLGDENYVNGTDAEYSYVNGYKANIASINEQKINPITDGEIVYHTYGPRKTALANSTQSQQRNILNQLNIEQIPLNTLAFSDYGYATIILWSPSNDNESVLGAANVSQNITSKRIKEIFTEESYTALDENDLIRDLYILTSDPTTFPTFAERSEAKRSLIVYLDVNEGVTIQPYEGMILVDNEYIKYRGKLYYVASDNVSLSGYKIIFSEEEFSQIVSNMQRGDSLIFKGLVVDIRVKIVSKSNNQYVYKIISDGRGTFNTTVTEHSSLAETSDGISPSNTFKLKLGANKLSSENTPGELKATTKFNFKDKAKFKSARRAFGNLPEEALNSYLGFLHISGPNAPSSDQDAVNSILNPGKKTNIQKILKDMDKQVDSSVPGIKFDSYVYFQGEKNIYGQKIPLNFTPNAISTRMRLYSPRRKTKNQLEVTATISSIAGIGFGLNDNNEGYYLEIENAGSGKKLGDPEKDFLNNLRFYRVKLKQDKEGVYRYSPELLKAGSVGAFTTTDTAIDIIKADDVTGDPVVELDILIKKYGKKMEYTILYGGQEVFSYEDDNPINVNSKNIFMFVRNDSQAIYEYIMAAARPSTKNTKKEKDWFRNYRYFNRQIEKGIIPVTKQFYFQDKDKNIKFYFNDFAKLAREVKEYDIRFTAPAFVSQLIDISNINPKYFVKDYESTAFGAKLVLVNSSGGAITLGNASKLPLFITGVAAEEINTGQIALKDIEDLIEDDKKRITDREKNIALYGVQTFTLDSQYIQSIYHAKNIMRWVSRKCSRPRIKLSLEVFANPLLELGDKVKIFDKSRGYRESNSNFGPKTFVISSISHSINAGGPAMTIDITEVGE